MESAPQQHTNYQITKDLLDKQNKDLETNFNDADSSICSKQSGDPYCNEENRIVQMACFFPRYCSTNLVYPKNFLAIEDEFFHDKTESALEFIFYPNKENNEEKENNNEGANNNEEEKKNNERGENKNEGGEKNNEREVKIEKNSEEDEEIKYLDVDLFTGGDQIFSPEGRGNENSDKDEDYTQTYNKNDFNEQPPKVSLLFSHEFNLDNKKIPNIFYEHMFINKNKKEKKKYKRVTTSERNENKLVTIIYYSP